jgi:hypothetical protein
MNSLLDPPKILIASTNAYWTGINPAPYKKEIVYL